MRLTILQEKLKEGFGVVERITSKSLTLPILNNVLLQTKKNFLNLAATDLEIGINWWTLAKVEEEGAIVIPSQSILSLISLFPNKPVNISTKDLAVNIECENHKSSFKGLSTEDFPIIPSITEGETLRVSASSFCEGLTQVVNIPALSTTKPEISGVYLVFQGNTIKMVATDSFRLGEKTLILKRGREKEGTLSFILPQRAAKEIINVFSKEKEIKIYFSPNQILFESLMEETEAPKIRFISRLIEGEFPNYEAIIPKKQETQVVLPRKEFLNQIKSASIFSGKTNEIKLTVNPTKKQVEISGQSQDFGEYHSDIPAKIKGKGLEIAFNYKFLTEGVLTAGDKEEIVFELTSEEGAAVLKQVEDPSYIYILMPIKKN
ncbi:MAG: DNA polymerase III subunit beta [bacterium]|nr:DNA polymerase III subunit beta [bacterium]